jgi:hypothetical protein
MNFGIFSSAIGLQSRLHGYVRKNLGLLGAILGIRASAGWQVPEHNDQLWKVWNNLVFDWLNIDLSGCD